jgi:hypothetical protein
MTPKTQHKIAIVAVESLRQRLLRQVSGGERRNPARLKFEAAVIEARTADSARKEMVA